MKVIIAGGRDFDDYDLLEVMCNYYLKNAKNIEVVSGTANGANKLGEKWAKQYSHNIKSFPANWNKYGKRAGYLRNTEMGEYSDALIAFWDHKSKGTKHMIDTAHKHNLKVRIVRYYNDLLL